MVFKVQEGGGAWQYYELDTGIIVDIPPQNETGELIVNEEIGGKNEVRLDIRSRCFAHPVAGIGNAQVKRVMFYSGKRYHTIIFDGGAYLLNNQGKTLETIN